MKRDGQLEAWAQAAGRGDRSALSDLYDGLSPDLLGYLVDLTRSRSSAEDLLHEAWLRAIRGFSKRRAPVRLWMFRIARNLAVDQARGRQRREKAIAGARSSVASATDRDERSDDDFVGLRQAVARLPDEQRDVVLLRYYSGLTFAQIAEVVDQPQGTVVFRVRRALSVLRKELAHEISA